LDSGTVLCPFDHIHGLVAVLAGTLNVRFCERPETPPTLIAEPRIGGRKHPRRQWDSGFYSAFYFSDDDDHRQIQELVTAIQNKHGLGEAAAALRQVTVEAKQTNGRRVLDDLSARWSYLLGLSIDSEIGDLLDDLQGFRQLPD
jgi:hypothetical protein